VDFGFLPVMVGELDVDLYSRSCPSTATTLGTFFQNIYDVAIAVRQDARDSLVAGLKHGRWVSFRSYPFRDFIRLVVNAAPIVHASLPLAEGIRRLGRLSYPSFSSTMAGRVILFALGDGLENLLEAMPKAYEITVPSSSLAVTKIAPRHYKLALRDMYCFPDSYHLGVLEGGFLAYCTRSTITVQRGDKICDVDFDVRW
jgi:uncharacterized protein (TIGR02265 family)